jgi:hypothetical protein
MICNKITAGNIYNNITDHLPNFIFMEMHKKRSHRIGERPMIRLYSDKNISIFKTLLSKSNWKPVLICQDANIAHKEFTKIYDQAFNEAFPLVRLSKKRAKDKKWFSAGLKRSKQKELNLYRIKVKSPTTNNISKYNRYWQVYAKCVRAAEQQYFKDLINSKKQNVTMLWKIFGPVINPGKDKKRGNISKLIKENGLTITDNIKIADEFNKYFTSVGNQLANKIKSNKSYKTYLKNSNQNNFFLRPTTEDDVSRIINKLQEWTTLDQN